MGVIDLGSPLFVLHNQPFVEGAFDNILTHEAMFATAPDGTVVPRLVREWSLDPTGLVATFRLQEGVKWHQGYGDWGDFNADDFIWSLQDVSQGGSPHSSAEAIRRVFTCEECSLTKVDDYTVELERPTPSFEITWHSRAPSLGVMSFHSKAHYDAVGEETATSVQSVGTGPWELVETITGDRKTVQGVRDHWRKTPEFAEMVWHEFIEQSTMLANFLTGDLDAGQFELTTIQAIRNEDNPNHKFMTFPGAAEITLHLLGGNYHNDSPSHTPDAEGNVRIPLGENTYDCSLAWVSCDRDTSSAEWENARKVRLALSLAVDRQRLVNGVALGEGAPHFVRDWLGFDSRLEQFGLDELALEYNPIMAKQLLTEAGYGDGFEIKATLTPGAGAFVTQAVATMWEPLGVTTNQVSMPYAAMRPSLAIRTVTGIWTQAFPPSDFEPLDRYNSLHSANGLLGFSFEHPDFQALMDEANMTIDDDARWSKQAEMARWIFDNTMLISVFGVNVVWPLGPKVDTWEPMGGNKLVLSNWEYAPHRQ